MATRRAKPDGGSEKAVKIDKKAPLQVVNLVTGITIVKYQNQVKGAQRSHWGCLMNAPLFLAFLSFPLSCLAPLLSAWPVLPAYDIGPLPHSHRR